MSSLSHPKYQRQRIVKYAQEHSVTETAIRYKVSRKTVYILAYQELAERDGYTRSYGGFKRIAARLKALKPAKKRKGNENQSHTSGWTIPGRRSRLM